MRTVSNCISRSWKLDKEQVLGAENASRLPKEAEGSGGRHASLAGRLMQTRQLDAVPGRVDVHKLGIS